MTQNSSHQRSPHGDPSQASLSENARAEAARAEAARSEYRQTHDFLLSRIAELIQPLGFELVEIEIHTHRQKILRLFIDRLPTDSTEPQHGVTIDDCARVSRALDEPLDQVTELEALFRGQYELEVSSPGVDRPLRHERDFARFQGRRVRIHLVRPLEGEESGNAEFTRKHPKQISFLGTLMGTENSKVLLAVAKDDGSKPGASGKAKAQRKPTGKKPESLESLPQVAIPLPLISKAHLDPEFDFSVSQDDEVIIL